MARTLLTLPTEIRLIIFNCHFKAQVISRGFGNTVSKNTSLLSTCWQIYAEARPFVGHINSFHFRSPAAMLDTLTRLDPRQIQEIRRIRVKAFPFPIHPYDLGEIRRPYVTHDFSDILPLFPGLQLDRLEVEDAFHYEGNDGWGDVGTYGSIESLIQSDGWKELYFVTPTTEFMSGVFDEHNDRTEQPDGWNQWLQNRDGEESGAQVRMVIANDRGARGVTEDPDKHAPYSAIPGHLGKPSPAEEWSGEGFSAVMRTDRPPEIAEQREVSIIARRGKNVSYVQDGSKIRPMIRELFDQMLWQEIKEEHFYVDGECDPCGHL